MSVKPIPPEAVIFNKPAVVLSFKLIRGERAPNILNTITFLKPGINGSVISNVKKTLVTNTEGKTTFITVIREGATISTGEYVVGGSYVGEEKEIPDASYVLPLESILGISRGANKIAFDFDIDFYQPSE